MEKKVPYTGNNSADLIRDGKDVIPTIYDFPN